MPSDVMYAFIRYNEFFISYQNPMFIDSKNIYSGLELGKYDRILTYKISVGIILKTL